MKISSIRALVEKEVHHLIPLIVALFALELLGLFESFITKSPDTVTWSDLSVLLNPGIADVAGVIYVILGLVTAYVLFPHEGKLQTLQFLWSLPVRRWQIYVVKLATAMLVLAGMILFGHLALLWVNSFSIGSITGTQFSWALWWRELAVLCGVLMISLGYGALVASFRMAGVLGLLAAWATVIFLAYTDASFEFLDPTSLLALEFRGSEILLNPKTWQFHSIVALICALIGGYRWTRDSRAPAERSKSSRIAARVGGGLSVVVVLFLIVAYGVSELAPGLGDEDYADDGLSLESFETEYYEISFYNEDVEQARILMDEAEPFAEQVMQQLGFKTKQRILADLTDNSQDHLGIAGWKKLRMERNALYDDELRSHVFVHETAHVVAAAASDRRLADHHSHAIFFSEGQAEWVAFEILGLEDQRNALRLLSALAWKRLNLRFEDMLYAGAFRSQFDENLIYALGEAWVSTLAEVCGDSAPGEVLQAMNRPGAPRNLAGTEFWRDTLQASGCDLGAVNSQFVMLMRSYESRIEDVPDLSGAVDTIDGRFAVSLTLGPSADDRPYRVFVRVRDGVNAGPLSVTTESAELSPGQSTVIDVPLHAISGQRFQYQFGLEFIDNERPFFSRWLDGG